MANASAAHAFFAPAAMDLGQQQRLAMAADMAPNRKSSDILPDLKATKAQAIAARQAFASDLQQRFGCRYLAST